MLKVLLNTSQSVKSIAPVVPVILGWVRVGTRIKVRFRVGLGLVHHPGPVGCSLSHFALSPVASGVYGNSFDFSSVTKERQFETMLKLVYGQNGNKPKRRHCKKKTRTATN